jgi:hypothetical protein
MVNVRIRYKTGDVTLIRDVSEIHYGYQSPLGRTRIAFESPRNAEGCSINIEDIEEFEMYEEKEWSNG